MLCSVRTGRLLKYILMTLFYSLNELLTCGKSYCSNVIPKAAKRKEANDFFFWHFILSLLKLNFVCVKSQAFYWIILSFCFLDIDVETKLVGAHIFSIILSMSSRPFRPIFEVVEWNFDCRHHCVFECDTPAAVVLDATANPECDLWSLPALAGHLWSSLVLKRTTKNYSWWPCTSKNQWFASCRASWFPGFSSSHSGSAAAK